MRHLIELRFNGGIDRGMAVTVDVCPNGGVSIDIFATMAVPEDRASALDEHERVVLRRAPSLHLRKGMPEMLFFGGDEKVGFHVRK